MTEGMPTSSGLVGAFDLGTELRGALSVDNLKTVIRGFPGGAVVENLLPMQGTRVRALVWEDPTCRGATRPVSHNY